MGFMSDRYEPVTGSSAGVEVDHNQTRSCHDGSLFPPLPPRSGSTPVRYLLDLSILN